MFLLLISWFVTSQICSHVIICYVLCHWHFVQSGRFPAGLSVSFTMLHMSWVLQVLLQYWWCPPLTAPDSPVQGVPCSRSSPTETIFLCRSPSWEYTDTFHMHVFLPADGKCSHERSPQTHFCLCLMDGYDRSSFFHCCPDCCTGNRIP